MPIFFQQDIDVHTKLAIWKIEEEEGFFLASVPLQREITHPHKRLQHLAGRYLLKYLFGDFPLELIRIADTRKPFLENEAYHFSISHCGDYAAVIVSQTGRVGVDIETPTPKIDRVKHKFLHPEELLMGKEYAAPRQETLLPPVLPATVTQLTLLWSCKEAVFKWWSYGNVDFSEQIRLQPFLLEPEGSIQARFIGPETIHLQLQYRLFAPLCLAWVKT
ncbi:MAG: 4'-phosphopantetheinyl transferase family protein [Flavisolibacter sp.]